MTDPIDIKSKKIIKNQSTNSFSLDKNSTLESIENNILENWGFWSNFQQEWCNRAFRTFYDYDKYLVLMYLFRQTFEKLTLKFKYDSMEDFYSNHEIMIERINLIKISQELNIPKETIRRKVNEFQQEGVLKRDGKKIILRQQVISLQKPVESINTISKLIEKLSKSIFESEKLSQSKISLNFEEIKELIKKYFTIIWLRFYQLQIPYLIRHRNIFDSLETWNVWGVVAMHHQNSLQKVIKNSVISNNVNPGNYYKKIIENKPTHGINASSISDISNIPRATVIRKLKWLIKNELVKKNKYAEYFTNNKGKKNKNIKENMDLNQSLVAEFLADVLDIMINSSIKV